MRGAVMVKLVEALRALLGRRREIPNLEDRLAAIDKLGVQKEYRPHFNGWKRA
jgi:hypothetical protein